MKKQLKNPLATVAASLTLSSIATRTMKTAIFSLWLSALALPASAADAQQPSQSTPQPQLKKITAVAPDADKRTLVVRYQIAGVASEERITFAKEVADFRYCPWYGDHGIAVVARTGAGKTSEYSFSAFALPSDSKKHKPVRIPAPPGDNPVLGIGSTGGDSVVITAVQHSRGPSESISGWVYIDNCPATESGLVIGHVTPFTVPVERPQPK